MDHSERSLVKAGFENLHQIIVETVNEFDITFDAATIFYFEMLGEVMRNKAPMEFDEYLDVFREELPKAELANQERLSEFRNALADTIQLVCAS